MRIPRVFAARLPDEVGGALTLEGEEATHLARVLRVKPGALVEAFDGEGRAGRFEVVAAGRRGVDLRLVERRDGDDRALPFEVVAAVATPKGKRAQRLVEALTELGAAAWVPLDAARTEERAPREDDVARWSREACKQCGRSRVLRALAPVDAAGVAALARGFDLAVWCDTTEARPLREALARPRPGRTLVVVGPEGGFAPEERAALRAAGLSAVTLGPTVLRVETAAAAVVAALVVAWA